MSPSAPSRPTPLTKARRDHVRSSGLVRIIRPPSARRSIRACTASRTAYRRKGHDLAGLEQPVERRQVVRQEFSKLSVDAVEFRLDAPERVALRIRRGEVRAAGDVAAARADLGI